MTGGVTAPTRRELLGLWLNRERVRMQRVDEVAAGIVKALGGAKGS